MHFNVKYNKNNKVKIIYSLVNKCIKTVILFKYKDLRKKLRKNFFLKIKNWFNIMSIYKIK